MSWSRKASGSSARSTWRGRGQGLALVLGDHGRGDLGADRVDLVLLAGEVGLQGGEAALGLFELEPGVVVALGGLLGLVVQRVDAGLDVVDVRLGEGGAAVSIELLTAVMHRVASTLAVRFRPSVTSGRSPLCRDVYRVS